MQLGRPALADLGERIGLPRGVRGVLVLAVPGVRAGGLRRGEGLEQGRDRIQALGVDRLIEARADRVLVDEAQQVAGLGEGVDELGGAAGDLHAEGVEERAVHELEAVALEVGGQVRGARGDLPGDPGEALGPVVDGVHRGHDRQQHLGGADVRRRLLAADVLLAGLQREAEGRVALGVLGDAHEAPGQLALEALGDGHEPGVRAAEAHRDAEALGGADHDVRAELPGGRQQGEGQQVRGDDREALGGVDPLDHRLRVPHEARGRGHLHEHAEGAVGQRRVRGGRALEVGDDEVDAHGLGAPADHSEGRVEDVGVDDEAGVLRARRTAGQEHGLGRGRRLVEHRRVGDRHAGELGDHRLVGQQRLEAALRDLRLVGRVGRVPGGVLEDVALDHRRGEGPVVALAQQGGAHGDVAGEAAELVEHLLLGDPGAQGVIGAGVQQDRAGDGAHQELLEIAHAQGLEHPGLRALVGADVAAGEGIVVGGAHGDGCSSRRTAARRASGRSWGRGRAEAAPAGSGRGVAAGGDQAPVSSA